MIPKRYIEEWKQKVSWIDNQQIEQDLVISRALVAIYSDDFLKERLAFRGGTALHKLFTNPAARYSEDIDLVQITPESIGEVLGHLRKALSFIEGSKPNIDRGESMTTMHFHFLSENNQSFKLKLKVEINCREHISVFGLKNIDFSVENTWFSGSVPLITYEPEELLGTKLRALYQRRKGRDLFDLWYSLSKLKLDPEKIIIAFHKYMELSQHTIRRNDFLSNMNEKIKDPDFRNDIVGLLHPSVIYNIDEGYEIVKENLISIIKI